MDDNKLLTLSSGERIPADGNLRLIFTTCNAMNLTMATISRCAVIRLENDALLEPKAFQHAINKDESNPDLDFTNDQGVALTTNIRKNAKLLTRLVDSNTPAILVGPSASGKTVLLRMVTKLVGAKLWMLPLTPSTTVKDVLDQLFKLCSVKRYVSGHVLEPICSKVFVCFKHLDLASEPVLELLRVLASCRTFWHSFKRNAKLGNQRMKLAENISIFTTSQDVTRLSHDLTRHFYIVRNDPISFPDLESICSLILSDAVDTFVASKMVTTFGRIQQAFEGSNLAVNTSDFVRWAVAVRDNPSMLASLAYTFFGLRSARFEDSISAIIWEAFDNSNPIFDPFASPLATTDDFLRTAGAMSAALACPAHFIIYGPRGLVALQL